MSFFLWRTSQNVCYDTGPCESKSTWKTFDFSHWKIESIFQSPIFFSKMQEVRVSWAVIHRISWIPALHYLLQNINSCIAHLTYAFVLSLIIQFKYYIQWIDVYESSGSSAQGQGNGHSQTLRVAYFILVYFVIIVFNSFHHCGSGDK